MKIGIVGSEAAKFTPVTEAAARHLIKRLILDTEGVISGECHLGGADIYAQEEAESMGLEFWGCPPARLQWEGGYKQRNLLIAKLSDRVDCITVKELPEGYEGMRFSRCYHCKPQDHVKSGGCWTVKQAVKMGKQGWIHIISPDGSFLSRPFL